MQKKKKKKKKIFFFKKKKKKKKKKFVSIQNKLWTRNHFLTRNQTFEHLLKFNQFVFQCNTEIILCESTYAHSSKHSCSGFQP